MILLCPWEERYASSLRKLSPSVYLTVLYHRDVLPGQVCLAVNGESVVGAGLLKATSTWLSLDCLDYAYVNAELVTDPGADSDGAVSALILGSLKSRMDSLRQQHPGKRLILRLWRDSTDLDFSSLLLKCGFRPMRTIPVMVRHLTDRDVLTAPAAGRIVGTADLEIARIDPRDPEVMKEYLRTNGEAFGIPDSPEDLLFTLCGEDAGVFAVLKIRQVIASVTLWKISEDRAATENIFCAEDFRRQGITGTLLAHVFGLLREMGYEECSLSVFGDNQPALQLYLKLGYRLAGFMLEYHEEPDYRNVGY